MHPAAEELRLLIASGYPLLYLLTPEENRARALIAEAVGSLELGISEWSLTGGPEAAGRPGSAEALLRSLRHAGAGVTLLIDFHHQLTDPEVLRLLRDLAACWPRNRHTAIILAPVLHIPPDIEKDVALVELALPTPAELAPLLSEACTANGLRMNQPTADAVLRAAQGLTHDEARRVFSKALRVAGQLARDAGNGVTRAGGRDSGSAEAKAPGVALYERVLEEKRQSVRKSELLEYLPLEENLDQVGGLGEVKRWVQGRARAFEPEAARYGLPAPRGLLLIGVQGCGKSLMAKAVAAAWRLPLTRLDLAAVFGSPSAEAATRRATRLAESLAPVVLWIDEVEKGFYDAEAGGATNSGRVFGSFVTWLQEKRVPVFVVATANEVATLPPELLRKGRFDETFFLDLPDVHERRDILAIHLCKRGRDPDRFDLQTLARRSEHFSGAELEQAVVSGMYRAFAESREVTAEDIGKELEQIVPLYETFEERIKALRQWAKTRARPASQDRSLADLFD